MSFRIQRNYLRIFLWITTFFTIIIIPFSLFLSGRFAEFAYAQINAYNQDKTQQTADRMEFILRNLKSYGLQMYEDPMLQQWLQSHSRDPVKDYNVVQKVTDYLSTEPYIKQAFLINMKREAVVDSSTGLLSFADIDDPSILELAGDVKNRPEFLQFIHYEWRGKSHLAMVFPSTPSKHPFDGYLVMLLDNELLQKYLIGDGNSLGTGIVIIDHQGHTILGQLPESYEYPRGVDNEAQAINALMEHHSTISRNGWFVNTAELPTQEWTVYTVSRLEEYKRKVTTFQADIVKYSVLLLCLLLLVAFWNSRRLMQPFRRLAEQIQRRFGSESKADVNILANKDEYETLEQGFTLLSSRLNQMSQSMREHYNVIKAEYLRQWILQGRLNQAIKEAIDPQSSLFSDPLRLSIIKIDAYHQFAERYDFSSRKLLKYAIGNIVGEVMDSGHMISETVDLGEDHIVVVFQSSTGANMQFYIDSLQQAANEIKKYINVELTVGLSSAFDGYEDIRSVYDFVYELTHLKFVFGVDKIYTEEDYERYMQTHHSNKDLDRVIDNLVQAVRVGKESAVTDSIDQLVQHMQHMKLAECKFHLSQVFFTVYKTFSKYTSLKDVEGIQSQLERFSTLYDVGKWLEQELFAVLHNFNNQKRPDRKEKLIEEIKEYVHYHIHDPMLSVEQIADHVSLSAKYVREMFNEISGTSLSAYILDIRLNKVKEMLQSTNIPVKDIAENCGFLTRSHFFTEFKKTTGLTPSEYRAQSTNQVPKTG